MDQVISKYWGDYEDHKNEFMPAFLANDVLRLWRTFCVNYEAGTAKEPEIERIKRRLKNYKLKYSRLLTCYSALVFLLAISGRARTVRPNDVKLMVKLSPTERLEWLHTETNLLSVRKKTMQLIKQYEQFLERTNASKEELIDRFQRSSIRPNHVRTGPLVREIPPTSALGGLIPYKRATDDEILFDLFGWHDHVKARVEVRQCLPAASAVEAPLSRPHLKVRGIFGFLRL